MTTSNRTPARGFSLVEILIAVFVLALGLVGLAAIFPTVVRQQQVSSDQVVALSASRSAIASLRGNRELGRAMEEQGVVVGNDLLHVSSTETGVTAQQLMGWHVLTWNQGWSPAGQWVLPVGAPLSVGATTGELLIGTTPARIRPSFGNVSRTPVDTLVQRGGVRIPITDRLWPSPINNTPGAPTTSPRFVWDMVARRVDAGLAHGSATTSAGVPPTYRDDDVEIAIFVRHIDPGIRAGAAQTVGDALLPNGTTGIPRALPVGADAQTGMPTLDGTGAYSAPRALEYRVRDRTGVNRREIDLKGERTLALLPLAGQMGQLLLDDVGVVHRVTEVIGPSPSDRAVFRVAVDPEMSLDLGTVVYTPQVPASVEVYRVTPNRPASN